MIAAVNTEQLDQLGLSIKKEDKKSKELGQEDFLKLMTTQLQNQDPFKPMENGEFLGQIAQFGMVNGIQDLQKSFSSLGSSLVSNQALQASSLVGRTVLVEGEGVHLSQSQSVSGILELPTSANSVVVEIKDEAGQVINQVNLGQQKAGSLQFTWDGTNANGERVTSGMYSMRAIAATGDEQTGLDVLHYADVESVTLAKGDNGITLNLSGIGPRQLSDIREIK